MPDRGLGRISVALILIAIVSSAFNDLLPVLPIGELARDAFVYTLPLLVLYFIREPGKIAVPVPLGLAVLGFAAVLAVGVAVNYDQIWAANFKGRSGISRVATQGIAVFLGFFVALVFYNYAVRGHAAIISRGARIAMIIMAVVGVIEFGSWYGLPLLTPLHEALAAVIHAGSREMVYPQRLRMTAFEVSWAAVMLTFLFPFAIATLPIRGWQLPAYLALTFVTAFLAQSRTALLVIGCQALLMAWVFARRRLDLVSHAVALGCLAVILLLVSPGTKQVVGEKLSNMITYGSFDGPAASDPDENVSNVTRLAAIRAGLSMFHEHPVVGVGLGQYGFHYSTHIQAGDLRSWEVRDYVTDAEEVWPPTYSIHARLLAEMGIAGYGIWLALLLPPLLRSLMNAGAETALGRMHLAVAMTLSGWLLLGASIDSFRFFGGWIALGVGLALPPVPRHPGAARAFAG